MNYIIVIISKMITFKSSFYSHLICLGTPKYVYSRIKSHNLIYISIYISMNCGFYIMRCFVVLRSSFAKEIKKFTEVSRESPEE